MGWWEVAAVVAVRLGVVASLPAMAANLSKGDLAPVFLIPPLCGSRLRAWSKVDCTGALDIRPGDSVWVNAPLISAQPRCWLECARLWGEEMDDSPGCSSRADEGLDAISTLAEGLLGHFSHSMYELIEALVELGYDPTTLRAAPYDFRLTPDKLEARDGYFSKLRADVEHEVTRLGKRTIVVAHSLGCRVFAYFLKWLEADLGARHATRWIDRHVAMYVANGNPVLGSPDVATSLIVGAQQGMPISLKLIHEVLASSGGLVNLAPSPASTAEEDRPAPPRDDGDKGHRRVPQEPPWTYRRARAQRPDGPLAPHLRTSDFPWLAVDAALKRDAGLEFDAYGPEPCAGPRSTLRFFETLTTALNDSHASDLAAFTKRLCADADVGDAFDVGVERPPIDEVHVAYGVGLTTRLSTKFGLLPTPSYQTPPYFALEDAPLRFARQFAVRGYVDETGLGERAVTDDSKRILASHQPGRSGDDTVPYASLSAAHAWLLESSPDVSVFSLPLRKKFLPEEVVSGTYDRRNRAGVFPSAQKGADDPAQQKDECAVEAAASCPGREPRVTVFEAAGCHPETGAATRTTVWEMEGASHRTSANHPVFLAHVQRLVAAHALDIKAKAQQGLFANDLTPADVQVDHFRDVFRDPDFVPADDTECFWSFANTGCAYPAICEYRYSVGDLSLSQSCRLKLSISKDDARPDRDDDARDDASSGT